MLVIPQPFEDHNGGMVEFGSDGYLYIGMGDGGSGNDPKNRAQNIDELLGKILRIDMPTSGTVLYSSPQSNPFSGSTPGRDEIYAYGFRNPWRFSFERMTGRLYVADVGQDTAEEIDIVALGVPGPARGSLKRALGGWSISGITAFQSGAPFSLQNGFDRNNDGFTNDRPDIGNPRAPINSRAVPTSPSGSTFCATGYRNPDTGLCVTPGDVHWVQAGLSLPNASTVGRSTLVAGGINNFDLSLSKSFQIREQRRLEFRWEAFNALNHPQFTQIPNRNVLTAAPGQFLNRDFTDSGIRSMWVQIKMIF